VGHVVHAAIFGNRFHHVAKPVRWVVTH
jgi:hypothetical protein